MCHFKIVSMGHRTVTCFEFKVILKWIIEAAQGNYEWAGVAVILTSGVVI